MVMVMMVIVVVVMVVIVMVVIIVVTMVVIVMVVIIMVMVVIVMMVIVMVMMIVIVMMVVVMMVLMIVVMFIVMMIVSVLMHIFRRFFLTVHIDMYMCPCNPAFLRLFNLHFHAGDTEPRERLHKRFRLRQQFQQCCCQHIAGCAHAAIQV